MIKEKDKRFIEAALLALNRIELVSSEHSAQEAQEDFRISDVLLMEFENLANAVLKISQEFISDHPDIPIDELRSIRNRVAHDYLSVSLEILYSTIENDFSKLKVELRNSLSDNKNY